MVAGIGVQTAHRYAPTTVERRGPYERIAKSTSRISMIFAEGSTNGQNISAAAGFLVLLLLAEFLDRSSAVTEP